MLYADPKSYAQSADLCSKIVAALGYGCTDCAKLLLVAGR